MIKLNKRVILLLGLYLFINANAIAQKVQDDFISLVKSADLYPDFDDNYRILILNLITHPNSYYKRSEEKTYLTFKVVNEEYQMVLDEAALDSSILNFQLLLKSAYGRKTYYRLEKGEMVECWYKERGVTYSNNSDNSSTSYNLRTGYYDFMGYVKKFNGYLVQKRTKNIKSKQLRRAYRLVNSIRDTQYSRLQKMIKRYDRFVAKRLRKQDRKLAKAKKKYEREASSKGVE
ncbi:MAG: hypothetical protein PF517_20715 [Salinivirgaceae bacterium]|jgi:hypothetical protein|nr:hypothetical protein [Salinivirgaceae bacterium]